MKCRHTALSVGVAALVAAGCSGGSMQSVPNATTQTFEQSRAKSAALLYVSDTDSSAVYVFSYPAGKLQQTLKGFADPGGECVDAKGDVFVANTGGFDILEYAHGGSTPSATLDDSGWFPIGCAIDPTTGNLAVTDASTSSGSGAGDVAIYRHAKGAPAARYTDSKINEMLLCGYDDKGNLFVDGESKASAFDLAELRSGGKKLANVTLDQSIQSAGGVQWDGKYLAVGDQSANVIYQFTVSGTKGTKEGSTSLGGAAEVFQFWIAGSKAIGADYGAGDVKVWKYPAGGSEIRTITGLYVPLGVTLSR